LAGTIHVVDDDASFRTSIERRLKIAGYDVATYPTAQLLLDRIPEDSGPSCILLDVQIPDLSGPEVQIRLSERGSRIPIIFLTGHGDIQMSVRAIKAGAEDFLTKPVSSDQLLEAIRQALVRHAAVIDRNEKLDGLRLRLSLLTARERQVFDLVVRGKINKQVAHELGTTERTIKAHRHQVMEKMKVQSIAELVSVADRLGLPTAGQDGTRIAD
jgi:FixJ family two-component response regulator